jgi:hypothetical protein
MHREQLVIHDSLIFPCRCSYHGSCSFAVGVGLQYIDDVAGSAKRIAGYQRQRKAVFEAWSRCWTVVGMIEREQPCCNSNSLLILKKQRAFVLCV